MEKRRQKLLFTRSRQSESDVQARIESKKYEAPVLICYGDVRDVTLGGTINPGDPGVPGSTRRNF